MEKDRMLHPGDVFTDKDRKYQVIAVAYHAKSNEKMIVYQQLFDNFKILTDTFDDFFNQPEAEVHIEIPADDRKDNDADTKEDLKGGNPEENAAITLAILKGEKGPKREAVLMNAGAALYIGGKADSLKEGIQLAAELIDSGKALEVLQKLIEVSNRPEETV